MEIQITPRSILAFLGAVALAYVGGYGLGNISAKAVLHLTDDTPAATSNS